MSRIVDGAVGLMERSRRKQEAEARRKQLAQARRVYDEPADESRAEQMRVALAVEHGAPWLAAVVDIARQLQRQNLDAIAAAPMSEGARESSVRYSELLRFETVLLDAVDQARARVRDGGGTP